MEMTEKLIECREAIKTFARMLLIGNHPIEYAEACLKGDINIDEGKYPLCQINIPTSITVDIGMSSRWVIREYDQETGLLIIHETPGETKGWGLCTYPQDTHNKEWGTEELSLPGYVVDAVLAIHQLIQL